MTNDPAAERAAPIFANAEFLTGYGYIAEPKSFPAVAVMVMASAPQNVTRTALTSLLAPPA
jgi:hypothetical protein